jgi:hypothetical protein
MDTLTAGEYREALILLLAELEDLHTREPLEVAERLGRLQADVRTIAGLDVYGTEPIYGLRVLRRRRERPSGPDDEVLETGLDRDDQEEVVPDERP